MNNLFNELEQFVSDNHEEILDIQANYERLHNDHNSEEGLEFHKSKRNLYLKYFNTYLATPIVFTKDAPTNNSQKQPAKKQGSMYYWTNPEYNTDGKRTRKNRGEIGSPTHLLEFDCIIPHTIIKLYKEELIDANRHFMEVYTMLVQEAKLIKGHNLQGFRFFVKLIINYTYGIMVSNNYNFPCANSHLIAEHATPFYELLKILLPHQITEIYIDELYIRGNSTFVERSIEYVTELLEIPYSYSPLRKSEPNVPETGQDVNLSGDEFLQTILNDFNRAFTGRFVITCKYFVDAEIHELIEITTTSGKDYADFYRKNFTKEGIKDEVYGWTFIDRDQDATVAQNFQEMGFWFSKYLEDK